MVSIQYNGDNMKILAVIPARAGSKGIPNKNIRLMNGLPLICYSLENAINSKYITDIVVSTDSKEIEIISKQMGVNVRHRNKELCGDSVTLDSVVFDALCSYDSDCIDYVVTMQPTSPTLKVETLDAAIEFAISNKLDTVISVVNKPHLSWKTSDGKIIPNYEKRLNRQYLPPNYLETGGFVISKNDVVTVDSRIGKNVGVYPLSDDESVDIDDFNDWIIASRLLKKEKVAIYVNGNNKRGLGHVYRALELADEMYSKPEIIYDINQTDPTIFGETTHSLVPVNGIPELFERCKKEQYTLFINDILSTSIDYMIGLRSVLPTAKIINFEDDGEGQIKADLVFNALLSHNDLPNVYAGEEYYISGKLFNYYKPIEINNMVKKVFISFGGADPQNYSDRLLNIIKQEKYKNIAFVVVLGRAKENCEELLKFNNFSNITVLKDVKNMPEIMSQCDVAATSRGRTGYELAILGIPTFAMAQNKREEKHGFVSNENGFTYIGLNPPDEVIEATLDMYIKLSKESRLVFQQKLLSHDLKNGRSRVMKLIRSL